MTSDQPVTVVAHLWPCPECGHLNPVTTATCNRKEYAPMKVLYPTLGPGQELVDVLEEMGATVRPKPPAVVEECTYQRPCDLCDAPGRPYVNGVRCSEHVRSD